MAANNTQFFQYVQGQQKKDLNPAQRPPQVQAAINNAAASSSSPGYIYIGGAPYSCHTGHPNTDSPIIDIEKLIGALIQKKGPEQFTLLDIGTGNGVTLDRYRQKFNIKKGIGISLHQYREPDENYIVGDAHNLDKLLEKDQKFDLILGFKVYMHMIDPWGALVSAYNRLKPGGFLIIDEIPLACTTDVYFILDCLQEQGVELYANRLEEGLMQATYVEENALRILVLKKTTEALNLPLNYSPELKGKYASYNFTDRHRIGLCSLPEYGLPDDSLMGIARNLTQLFGVDPSADIFTKCLPQATVSSPSKEEKKPRTEEKKPVCAASFWTETEQLSNSDEIDLIRFEEVREEIISSCIEYGIDINSDKLLRNILFENSSIEGMCRMAREFKLTGTESPAGLALIDALKFYEDQIPYCGALSLENIFVTFGRKVRDFSEPSSESPSRSCRLM